MDNPPNVPRYPFVSSPKCNAVDFTPTFRTSSPLSAMRVHGVVQERPAAPRRRAGVAGRSSDPCAAAQPSSAPQLNVRPRKACGQLVTRFMRLRIGGGRGQRRGAERDAELVELEEDAEPESELRAEKRDGSGRRNRSGRDGTVASARDEFVYVSVPQVVDGAPDAPRLEEDLPTPKRPRRVGSGSAPAGAASAMDQKHGHARRYTPAGRSSLTSLA